MSQTQTITLFEGEDKTILFTPTPSAVNISGWTIRFYLKESYEDLTPLLDKAASIVSASAGTFNVPLTKADLTRAPKTYKFEARRTNAGFETVLADGDFVIRSGVAL